VVSESDPLHRPATAEEIEMVERLLKRTRPAENVVRYRRRGRCGRVRRRCRRCRRCRCCLRHRESQGTRAQNPKDKLLRVPVVGLERMLEEARPTPRDST